MIVNFERSGVYIFEYSLFIFLYIYWVLFVQWLDCLQNLEDSKGLFETVDIAQQEMIFAAINKETAPEWTNGRSYICMNDL